MKKGLVYAVAGAMIFSGVLANPVKPVHAASKNSMHVSVTAKKVRIKITRAKRSGRIYAYNANEYASRDKIRGASKKVLKSGVKIGSVKKNQSKTITFNRFDKKGRDNLYKKYYILNGGYIVKGPIYATSVKSAKKSIGFKQKSPKGLFTDNNVSNMKYAKDLGVHSITMNIDYGNLMYASKKYAPSEAIKFVTNGKTYYFNPYAVGSYDAVVKSATQKKMNVIAVLNAFSGASKTTYPQAIRYGNYAKSKATMGANTSNHVGRDDFIAMMEFLASRYSKKANGYITTYVLGNELDFTHYWYWCGNFNKYMEEYARAFRLANLAFKKYAGNVKVAAPFTHYWATNAGKLYHESPSPSFAPKKMIDWLAKYTNKRGAFDWALAPHVYGVVNSLANMSDSDSKRKGVLTGNYKTTKQITFTNLEVLNSYLGTKALKYKGKKRSVYLTECGASSGNKSRKEKNQQAATVAQTYYKVAHFSWIKSYNYYRLRDTSAERGLTVGLLTSSGKKKPAYNVYKKVDTKSTRSATRKYLKYITFRRNGKTKVKRCKSWKDAMKVYTTSWNWNKKWSWKKIIKR